MQGLPQGSPELHRPPPRAPRGPFYGIHKNQDFSDFVLAPLVRFLGPYLASLGPLGPGNRSGRPWARSRFGGVPNGPNRTHFRAIFVFWPVSGKSPASPRKGLTRPGRGHPKVAKGRPEVLARSQEGSGKVIRPLQKICSGGFPGYLSRHPKQMGWVVLDILIKWMG